jgi:hypothetical protein
MLVRLLGIRMNNEVAGGTVKNAVAQTYSLTYSFTYT